MDAGYVFAAFGATVLGTAAGAIIDPLTWVIACAVGATERVKNWRVQILVIFATVRTAIIAATTTLWVEDPIVTGAPWLDLVGKFCGYSLAFGAAMILASVVAARFRDHRANLRERADN